MGLRTYPAKSIFPAVREVPALHAVVESVAPGLLPNDRDHIQNARAYG